MKKRSVFVSGVLVLIAGCLFAAASIVNGAFSANLSGWNVAGAASAVGIQGNVIPPGGSTQALIASGTGSVNSYADVPVATIEADLNLPSGAIHTALPNNYSNVTNGSAIWQTFSATAGDVVTFNWNFATNEGVPTQWDAALYSVRVGSNPATVYELADTTQTASLSTTVTGSGLPFSGGKMTGYKQVSINIAATGTYTIGFISMQTGDDGVESGTYIANVGGASQAATSVPALSSWGLSILGILLLASSLLLLRKNNATHRNAD